MGSVRAVPRRYREVDFASTLEADWAAFLDALGIAWQYEPEAVQLPSGDLYRPDFYLPQCTTWLEVKGPHNDRIEKTLELGEAAAHYPYCTGVWRDVNGDGLHLNAWSDEEERALGRIIQAAPDGDTQVTVRLRLSQRDGQPRYYRTLRTHRLRRKIAVDRSTAEAIGDVTPAGSYLPCCNGYNIPWRMVVIGRAPVAGAATWESAQNLDIYIIKCDDCGEHSFFDEQMQWECRRCLSGGKVYRGGQWSSGHLNDGYRHFKFTRAPRQGDA